jgi:hypothetical protein
VSLKFHIMKIFLEVNCLRMLNGPCFIAPQISNYRFKIRSQSIHNCRIIGSKMRAGLILLIDRFKNEGLNSTFSIDHLKKVRLGY